MIESHYVYLHGFASSPLSSKAQYLHQCFAEANLNLTLIDGNDNDFYNLTLTRQLAQVQQALDSIDIPITVIGSSFGGLTAAWLGQRLNQINRLILLAPAFDFLIHLLSILGEDQVKQWQEQGNLPFYHYGYQQYLPLDYQFLTDLKQYQQSQIQRPIATLIVHGKYDEVIPIQSSYDYAQQRDWVQLVEVESDHSLADAMPQIWQLIKNFIDIK